MNPQLVLEFWFDELGDKGWWSANSDVDAMIQSRFEPLLAQAAAGELFTWRATAQGRLAEIIVLDQFSRNIYRGSPRAFSQDPVALVLAQEAVALEAYAVLSPVQRSFMLMPYMHSESKLVHEDAERLFKAHTSDNNYTFELKHKVIIDRFGRYPHRNQVLGRDSSAEEIEFLQQPDSSF